MEKIISYGEILPHLNYTVSVELSNLIDEPPAIYSHIISAKSETGFKISLSGPVESNNFVVEWMLKIDD